MPLFDRYKVDLVINGHNHVYERSDALRGNVIKKAVPIGYSASPATDGTIYLTAGGTGRSLYNFPAPDTYEGHTKPHTEVASYCWDADGNKVTETIGWSRVRYTGYSFLAVDVEPAHAGRTTTLTVRAVAENGTEIDRFTLKRMAGQVNQSARGVETAVPDLTAS